MPKLFVLFIIAVLAAAAAEPYQATTESLRAHKAPQWYEDAKFGIFIHWGPYAVPAYHEWYAEFISPKSNFGFMLGGPPYTATRGDLPEQLFLEKTRAEAVEVPQEELGSGFPLRQLPPDVPGREVRSSGVGAAVPRRGRSVRRAHRQAWRRIRHVAQPVHSSERNGDGAEARLGRRPAQGGPAGRPEDGLLSQHDLHVLGSCDTRAATGWNT